MDTHWQAAQEGARKEKGSNFVFTSDGKACIAGFLKLGWIIISSTHNLQLVAQTPKGVELTLEELGLHPLGWS